MHTLIPMDKATKKMPWTPNPIAVNKQDLEAYRRIGDSKMTFLIFSSNT